ncbi:glycosyltransferase family 2 protein [Candidatus Symbiothrix dinenymphae]|uniref:glycosyltransferase family 2 protein n=1 Tax=Candidatus Symbiothrix dinenymphae TaxID=467085 RepID=UPI001315197B|nr:glycosyltransferase family 2 protein [Candidatus Symbiothrix dinenymphae]
MIINVLAAIVHPVNRWKRKDFRNKLRPKMQRIPANVPNIDVKQIPIYIISYNRLSYVQSLVGFLEKRGFTNIHIVDNQSTYPPLLEYLNQSKHTVHFMDKNYGHKVFWKSGKFNDVIETQYYVVTDADILPTDDVPDDFMKLFLRLLCEYPVAAKVGFALKIDDVTKYDGVITYERQFWKNRLENHPDLELYDAQLDTTFALYRPSDKATKRDFYRAIRVAGDYVARHTPWYVMPTDYTDEDRYYVSTANKSSSLVKGSHYF